MDTGTKDKLLNWAHVITGEMQNVRKADLDICEQLGAAMRDLHDALLGASDISDAEAVKCQAERIRELVSENVKLARENQEVRERNEWQANALGARESEIAALKGQLNCLRIGAAFENARSLYGVLNAVRVVLHGDGNFLENLNALLPRMEEVLKEAERIAGDHK